MLEIETPHGPARAHLHAPAGEPRGALVLGHGAGGGVAAPDLVATTEVATARGLTVALIEQPYRVAGRRSTPAAHLLDEAWIAVLEELRARPLAGLAVVTGGRSSGARVACRTAAAVGAVGVLCLAFPLVAPSGKSRQEELDSVIVPVLVVQGENDRFGVPKRAKGRTVSVIRGDHALKSDRDGLRSAVDNWLAALQPLQSTSSRRARPRTPIPPSKDTPG
ncbi:MAG TPA: alpha/beta family hydrolase [Solirubrobacteraceae bacterium]|nr:alpha/beta family hydrolase [Solirubrobacteraceae bacterium]